MIKSILLILFILFYFSKSYSQQDTSQKVQLSDFKLSYEYLVKFINDYGQKDTALKELNLTDCRNPYILNDTFLVVNHSKGRAFVPYEKITGLSFQSGTCTIPGIVIGAVAGLSAIALSTAVYVLTHQKQGGWDGESSIGLGLILEIAIPVFMIGGAIPGGIIGSKIHQYKSYDLEVYPEYKRRAETLRLLKKRSKFKDY
jgi:hypothetical protein